MDRNADTQPMEGHGYSTTPDETPITIKVGNGPRRITDDIVSAFRRNVSVSLIAVISSLIVCCTVCCLSLRYLDLSRHGIYILSDGAAFSATLGDDRSLSMDLEIEDHVGRFHEHLFNLSPSKRAIEESLEVAYRLSDRSVYEYTMDLAEKGYYSRIVSANISQQIVVDSVKTEPGKRPYKVKAFSRLYIIRESSVSEYDLVSSCEVIPVHRSPDNPHGLLIEKFRVISEELSSSAKR